MDSFGIQTKVSILEAFLLGEFEFIDLTTYSKTEKLSIEPKSYKYSSEYKNPKQTVSYTSFVNNEYFHVDSLMITEELAKRNFRVNYDEYVNADSVFFPSGLSINVKSKGKDMGFDLQYKKVYKDKGTSIPAINLETFNVIKY
jgi:hypothetical protein